MAKRGVIYGFFRLLINCVRFVLIAHVSLPRAINEHNISNWEPKGRVVLYQYTPAIYTWPLITVGFYSLILDRYEVASPVVLGWVWALVLLLVIFTFLFDITRSGIGLMVLLSALALAVCGWLNARYQVPVERYLWQALSWFDMTFPRGIVLLVTLSLGVVYLSMLLWRRVDSVVAGVHDADRRDVAERLVLVHRFAAEALSYQAGGWALKARFHDLLEWLLGGGCGTLAIVHPITGKELFVATHVPGFSRIAAEVRRRFSAITMQDSSDKGAPKDKAA